MLQDELREVANKEVNDWFGEQIKAKSKGRNNDLSVTEYKVAQESRKLEEIQQQNNEEQAKNKEKTNSLLTLDLMKVLIAGNMSKASNKIIQLDSLGV